MRQTLAPVFVVPIIVSLGCELPSSDENEGTYTVCPFGWCEGSGSGDSGGWDGDDDDGMYEDDFLDTFAEYYCGYMASCEDEYDDSCQGDIQDGASGCSGYDADATNECLVELTDVDECWELEEGDWISPCRDVYDDCGYWWHNY